jgi:phosphatidylglycerol lysyltransferase
MRHGVSTPGASAASSPTAGAPTPRPTWRIVAISTFYIVLAAACAVAIGHALGEGGTAAVAHALASMPLRSVAASLASISGIFAVLWLMEQAALRRANAPRAAREQPVSALVANAVSLGAGFGMLSGGALRTRLYAQTGVDAPMAFYIASAVTLMSLLGGGLITALGLVFMPGEILAGPYWRWLGAGALVGFAGLLVFAGRKGHALTLFGRRLDFPAAHELAVWIGLGALDWLFSAGAFYALLPEQNRLAFPEFAALFTTSHFAAMPTGAPAGLGVFDAIMVSAAGGAGSPGGVAAALIVHRTLSFLLPVALGLIGLGALEARHSARRRAEPC